MKTTHIKEIYKFVCDIVMDFYLKHSYNMRMNNCFAVKISARTGEQIGEQIGGLFCPSKHCHNIWKRIPTEDVTGGV